MVAPKLVTKLGSLMQIVMDDGTKRTAVPAGHGRWIVKSPTTTPTPTTPVPAGAIYNPWESYDISGTWEEHMSYSLGGIDYPLGYGTGIKAPAAGTLHTSGGTGEYETGWVGSAGRRSILFLDADVPRLAGRPLQQKEGTGNLHAIVFQHQSAFGSDGVHYGKGSVLGKSGASADGQDYGGDIHLHVHGLNAAGVRLNLLNFIP